MGIGAGGRWRQCPLFSILGRLARLAILASVSRITELDESSAAAQAPSPNRLHSRPKARES